MAQMRARGFSIAQALQVLDAFEISLDMMRRHLTEIERDLA